MTVLSENFSSKTELSPGLETAEGKSPNRALWATAPGISETGTFGMVQFSYLTGRLWTYLASRNEQAEEQLDLTKSPDSRNVKRAEKRKAGKLPSLCELVGGNHLALQSVSLQQAFWNLTILFQ